MRITQFKQQGLISLSQSANKIDWKDILTNKRAEYDIPETPAIQAILDLFSLPSDPEKALETITGQISLQNVINAIDSLTAMGWVSTNAWKAVDRVSDKIRADATSEQIVGMVNSDKPLPALGPGVQSIKPELSKFKSSISRWRNVLGLLRAVNIPKYYQIIAQAKPAIDVLLSQEVQSYIDGVETSMLGAPSKGVPGAIQTLKWLSETIPAKTNQSSKAKGVESKPDIKTMDFNNKDEIAAAMENIDEVKNKFSDYDSNNEEHFNRVYLLGIESGKDLFTKEILRFRSKKYNSDNYQNGMETAASIVKGNKENVKKVLGLYAYGKNIDDVINFTSWTTFLLCVSESKTSSIDPGTLEKVCEKYVLRLNTRFPAWTRIPDFSKLPYLMQSDNAKQSNPDDNYNDSVDAGINLFSSIVIANDSLYNVNKNDVKGSNKAQQTMGLLKNQIIALAKRNGTSEKELENFIVAASFLFCLVGSGTTSASMNSVKKLWQVYTGQMTQSIPNWNSIKELSELNNLKSDVLNNPTNMDASEGDIIAAWQTGINDGLTQFEKRKNDQNIKFNGDVNSAESYVRSYMETRANKVVTSILLSKSFNKKALMVFASEATLLMALIKAKAVGVGNYNLKSSQTEMYRKLDVNWRGWQETQIFGELAQMSTSGGFGNGFSPEKAMQVWQKLMPKTIARIKGDVENNPALARTIRFKKLFSNGWIISSPNELEATFGEKLIFPESIQVAKETIRHSSSLKASNEDSTADYILNRIAAWCSGNYDYEDLEPAAQQNMAQKYYKDNGQQPATTQTPSGTKQPSWSDFPSFPQNNQNALPTPENQNSLAPGKTQNAISPWTPKALPPGPGTAVIPRPNMGVGPVSGPGTAVIQRPNMGVGPVKQGPYQLDPAEVNREQEKQKKQKDKKVKDGIYVGFQFLGTISMALAQLLATATERENLILE